MEWTVDDCQELTKSEEFQDLIKRLTPNSIHKLDSETYQEVLNIKYPRVESIIEPNLSDTDLKNALKKLSGTSFARYHDTITDGKTRLKMRKLRLEP